MLDFDATDDPTHGDQEGRFFHGYYDHYCFLPFYVFCGEQLLVSHLRPANIDGAKHARAILALLVKRLGQAPVAGVKIILRGDSGLSAASGCSLVRPARRGLRRRPGPERRLNNITQSPAASAWPRVRGHAAQAADLHRIRLRRRHLGPAASGNRAAEYGSHGDNRATS